MSLPERKLWELKYYTICRILGLTFDEAEVAKILRKFQHKQPCLTPAERHGGLVHVCTTSNRLSKYVDKMLAERFEPYRRKLEGLDQRDICELIEGWDGTKDIPLPALIWFALCNQHPDIEEIETRVFNAVHIREHHALRLHDDLSRVLPGRGAEGVLPELKAALAANGELERRYKRSEQKKEQLRSEIETIEGERVQFALTLAEQRQLNERLRKDLERLGGEAALEQIENLKKEIGLLNQEVRHLNEELLKRELFGVPDRLSEPLVRRKADVETHVMADDPGLA